MNFSKQMANSKFWDLITFLYLFPDADLICDGDTGVVTMCCDVENVAYGPAF
jgi:hypothetical protein